MMAPTAKEHHPETISSEELLQRVPSAENMQSEMRHLAEFVQEFCEDPRATHALDIIGQHLGGLPDVTEKLTRNAFATIFEIGNFCNAGGRIVFVDPPAPQDSSPAAPETQTQRSD